MVCVVFTVSTGAAFTSFTVRLKVCEADSGGAPLSVTCTVIGYTAGPSASVGVHEITPLEALMLIPSGKSAKL